MPGDTQGEKPPLPVEDQPPFNEPILTRKKERFEIIGIKTVVLGTLALEAYALEARFHVLAKIGNIITDFIQDVNETFSSIGRFLG